MKSFLRFLIFVGLLAVGMAVIYQWQRRDNSRLGSEPAKATLATGPRLDASALNVLAKLNQEYIALAQAVVPSVVSITTTKTVVQRQAIDPLEMFFRGRPFGRSTPQQKVTSLGSGVIVSKEGHIVTNNHVVEGTDEIVVRLNTGREATARLIGTDAQLDLAVLKIQAPNLTPLPLADSDEVRVGQLVFAIGNPFGLEESVSQGIISAKDRRGISESATEFFQTDTAINPGNSGGPLVNVQGAMVAINTAIYSESGGNQGIGFAIPANVVKRALTSIIQKGRVIRGYLGLSVQKVSKQLADEMKMDAPMGALVTDVAKGSPAEKAGVVKRDIILKIDDNEIRDPAAIGNRVMVAEIGSEVKLELFRDGTKKMVSATVGEQPSNFAARSAAARDQSESESTGKFLGIEVEDFTPRLRSQLRLPADTSGVVIKSIDERSGAAGSLATGDIIQEINHQAVSDVREFNQITSQLVDSGPVLLGVIHNRQRAFLVIQGQ